MAVPTAYLSTVKNINGIMDAVKRAGVPDRFTYEFLKQLGFGSSGDRPTIPVLKAIGFLTEGGEPTDRYRRFKDPATAGAAMAEGLRDAYSDLFAINTDAQTKSSTELKGMFGRLSDKGDAVNKKMATTFKALAELGDFSLPAGSAAGAGSSPAPIVAEGVEATAESGADDNALSVRNGSAVFSLRHDVHVHLPATTDIAVYNAIFRSLKETLQ
jgi:hypothetical protein